MNVLERHKPQMQCLNRALDILETLAQHRTLGVTELAKLVGLHVATTHNILSALQTRNYLLNDGGRYRLGPALAVRQDDVLLLLQDLAKPRLEEITGLTGESAVVGVLSGMRVIMIAATASVDGMISPARNQAYPSALALGTGRVLVAHRPEKEWQKHFNAYTTRPGHSSDTDVTGMTEWAEIFKTITETGQCLMPTSRDSGSVAVPIRDASGAVVAALGAYSVSRFGDEAHRNRLAAAVREAGQHISVALGCKPDMNGETH